MSKIQFFVISVVICLIVVSKISAYTWDQKEYHPNFDFTLENVYESLYDYDHHQKNDVDGEIPIDLNDVMDDIQNVSPQIDNLDGINTNYDYKFPVERNKKYIMEETDDDDDDAGARPVAHRHYDCLETETEVLTKDVLLRQRGHYVDSNKEVTLLPARYPEIKCHPVTDRSLSFEQIFHKKKCGRCSSRIGCDTLYKTMYAFESINRNRTLWKAVPINKVPSGCKCLDRKN